MNHFMLMLSEISSWIMISSFSPLPNDPKTNQCKESASRVARKMVKAESCEFARMTSMDAGLHHCLGSLPCRNGSVKPSCQMLRCMEQKNMEFEEQWLPWTCGKLDVVGAAGFIRMDVPVSQLFLHWQDIFQDWVDSCKAPGQVWASLESVVVNQIANAGPMLTLFVSDPFTGCTSIEKASTTVISMPVYLALSCAPPVFVVCLRFDQLIYRTEACGLFTYRFAADWFKCWEQNQETQTKENVHQNTECKQKAESNTRLRYMTI